MCVRVYVRACVRARRRLSVDMSHLITSASRTQEAGHRKNAALVLFIRILSPNLKINHRLQYEALATILMRTVNFLFSMRAFNTIALM
jgi:hypothetical protein